MRRDVVTQIGSLDACFEITHSSKEVILSGEKLNQPEAIERTLGSVYLDTLSWGGHFEIRTDYHHRSSWPFDKTVPKQEQKSELAYWNSTRAVRIYLEN